MERIIGRLFLPFLYSVGAFGENQFAYTPGRGSRDALLLLVLQWLLLFASGHKVALYCSDVSGAFNKVDAERLCSKLRDLGLHPQIVSLLSSWLRPREASIAVSGKSSSTFQMDNMVYQGTVWGSSLWNCYYTDSKIPIRRYRSIEIFFA